MSDSKHPGGANPPNMEGKTIEQIEAAALLDAKEGSTLTAEEMGQLLRNKLNKEQFLQLFVLWESFEITLFNQVANIAEELNPELFNN